MKWPEKRKFKLSDSDELTVFFSDGFNFCNNQARQAVEEALSVEKINKILERYAYKTDDYLKAAQAIRKQILTELWGGEK